MDSEQKRPKALKPLARKNRINDSLDRQSQTAHIQLKEMERIDPVHSFYESAQLNRAMVKLQSRSGMFFNAKRYGRRLTDTFSSQSDLSKFRSGSNHAEDSQMEMLEMDDPMDFDVFGIL